MEPIYVPVQIPNPPHWLKEQKARRNPKHPQMIKMREAAAQAHRLATEVKRSMLLEFLRSPSRNFDGTNESIAKALSISVRTVIRLMNGLVGDGRVRVKRYTAKTPMGFRTHREITLLSEVA